jgi:ligand-binding sensor domain-containing protein
VIIHVALQKWNPQTNKYVNYKNETLSGDTIGPLNRLLNLYEDSRGNIWFQRQGGFGVYYAAKDKIVSFFYTGNEAKSLPIANSFAEDRNGKVWVSSADGWIGYANAADPEKGIVYKTNIRDKGIEGDIQRLQEIKTEMCGAIH